MFLFRHWSAPPGVLIPVVVTLALHELGRRRIQNASGGASRGRERSRRQQAWLFRLGLLSVVVALASPIDYWADVVFWPHMIQHLMLIFLCGPLIVLGAPWLPVVRGLPPGWRRALLRAVYLQRSGRPLRAAGRWVGHPAVATVVFVAVFYAWHVPAAFDLTLENQDVHHFEHACFLAIGILLWGQLVGSHPFRPRWDPLRRFGLVAAVMFANWFLAIGMAFAGRPWYLPYARVAVPHMPLLPDQELGAAIMWVVPMIPMGIVAGWLVVEFINRDDDDEGRLQSLITLTRSGMYGGVEPTA